MNPLPVYLFHSQTVKPLPKKPFIAPKPIEAPAIEPVPITPTMIKPFNINLKDTDGKIKVDYIMFMSLIDF